MDRGPFKIYQVCSQEDRNFSKESSLCKEDRSVPPKVKFQLAPLITFDAFTVDLNRDLLCSSPNSDLPYGSPATSSPLVPNSRRVQSHNGQAMIKESFTAGSTGLLSNSNSGPRISNLPCSRCLILGHDQASYRSWVRCALCWNYGHIKKRCSMRRLTKARPVLCCRPSLDTQS